MQKEELIKMSKLEQKLTDLEVSNTSDHTEIKNGVIRIETKLDSKTDNNEFLFWRNLLVSGILLAIGLGVVSLMLERFVK